MDTMELIRRFVRAVAACDEISAQDLCAADAWHARAGSIYQLYRQLAGSGREYGLRVDGAPRASESGRSVVYCTVVRANGEPISGLILMCDHIPARLAGWSKSQIMAERYLGNAVPADLGRHTLTDDPAAAASARAFARDLARAASGERLARERLAQAITDVSGDPRTIAHLLLRAAAGARLSVEDAARLPVLERVLVRARWSRDNHDRTEPVWLYAERDHAGRLRWLAQRPLFDVDALLAY